MEENKKTSRLSLVKSPAGEGEEKNKKNLPTFSPEPNIRWENYHYSYAEFIHSYVKHLNQLRNSNNKRSNSKILQLFKPEAANS